MRIGCLCCQHARGGILHDFGLCSLLDSASLRVSSTHGCQRTRWIRALPVGAKWRCLCMLLSLSFPSSSFLTLPLCAALLRYSHRKGQDGCQDRVGEAEAGGIVCRGNLSYALLSVVFVSMTDVWFLPRKLSLKWQRSSMECTMMKRTRNSSSSSGIISPLFPQPRSLFTGLSVLVVEF